MRLNSYYYAKEMSRTQYVNKLKRNKPKPIANSQKRPSRISEEFYKGAFDKKIEQSEIHEKERIRIGKSENRKKKMELQGFSKKKIE